MSGVAPPTVDALRRVRRRTPGTDLWTCDAGRAGNAHTIRGVAPDVNHWTSCRGSSGSASLPSLHSNPRFSVLILFFKAYSSAYHIGWRTKIGEFWSTELRRIRINHPSRGFVILIE